MRKVNEAGIQLVESFEKFEANPYQDDNGIWTQGYGHTKGITSSSPTITQGQADVWMEDDFNEAEHTIDTLVKAALNDNQYSALCAFVFNIGYGHFKASSALALLNLGLYNEVPAHMKLWNECPRHHVELGLVRRRNAEVVLWLTPGEDLPNVA